MQFKIFCVFLFVLLVVNLSLQQGADRCVDIDLCSPCERQNRSSSYCRRMGCGRQALHTVEHCDPDRCVKEFYQAFEDFTKGLSWDDAYEQYEKCMETSFHNRHVAKNRFYYCGNKSDFETHIGIVIFEEFDVIY